MLRRLVLTFLFLLLALASAGFVRLNGAPLSLDLYATVLHAGTGSVLILTFAAGFGLGLLSALRWLSREARERRRLARELRLAEGELRTLRTLAPTHAR